MIEVKVIEIRPLNDGRSLKAFADVQVGDWIIRDWRIIKQNGGKAFISPPQVSWKNSDTGKIKFKGVLSMPSDQKQVVDLAILNAFQKEMEKRSGKQKQ